jgi:hypothetical protein
MNIRGYSTDDHNIKMKTKFRMEVIYKTVSTIWAPNAHLYQPFQVTHGVVLPMLSHKCLGLSIQSHSKARSKEYRGRKLPGWRGGKASRLIGK